MSERAQQVLKYFEEQKDYLNARVTSGIELYRKGTARIRVVDENGEPVKGAVIEAKETKQDFKFGANTFMIDELERRINAAVCGKDAEKLAGVFFESAAVTDICVSEEDRIAFLEKYEKNKKEFLKLAKG